jgi:hypothetical protein
MVVMPIGSYFTKAALDLFRAIPICFFSTLHVYISLKLLDRVKHELTLAKKRPTGGKTPFQEVQKHEAGPSAYMSEI